MSKPFLKSGYIGLAVIVVSLILMGINPQEAPKMPEGFTTPVLAFEFVQTEQEVLDLFGDDTAVRADLIRAFDLGSWVDFVYLLLYGGFLFTFALQVVQQTGNKLFWGTAVFAIIVMFADVMENVQLLGITSALETEEFARQLTLLPLFTWIKWGGLAILFLLLTPYFFTQNLFARFIGIVAIICFGLGGVAFLNRSAFNEYYALSVALMFVLMIAYSFTATAKVEPSVA
ncbi:MAG: hypothetical protein GY943_06740 [Chloroflexi bacterium]|nr:hypothetical protein [Chloroflexota bacterium]